MSFHFYRYFSLPRRLLVAYSQLVMKKKTTSRSSKNGSSSKRPKGLNRARSSAGKSKNVPGPIALDETEEQREKRLARRMALTLRAFRIAYENHH